MFRDVLFYERQNFHTRAHAVALVAGVGGLLLILPLPGDAAIGPWRGIPGAILLLGSVLALNLLTMSTWVYPDEIRIQFGRLLPYYHRSIPMASVRSVQIVDDAPTALSGRSGTRQADYHGEAAQFIHVRGPRSVFVGRENNPVLIGTVYPERLRDAIERALSELPQSGTRAEADVPPAGAHENR